MKMKIGILSDTHGQAQRVEMLVRRLTQLGAEMIIHCGDVGSPEVLNELVGLRSLVVFGNCDWDRATLKSHASIIGVCCHDIVAEIELEGKIIAVTHGDRPALKSQMLSSQKYDYFFQGHTHVREDIRVGKTRLINPGAVARSNPPVAALLDLTADQLEYIELNPTV